MRSFPLIYMATLLFRIMTDINKHWCYSGKDKQGCSTAPKSIITTELSLLKLILYYLFSDAKSLHYKRRTTHWNDSCSAIKKVWLMRRRKQANQWQKAVVDVHPQSGRCPRTLSMREADLAAYVRWPPSSLPPPFSSTDSDVFERFIYFSKRFMAGCVLVRTASRRSPGSLEWTKTINSLFAVTFDISNDVKSHWLVIKLKTVA